MRLAFLFEIMHVIDSRRGKTRRTNKLTYQMKKWDKNDANLLWWKKKRHRRKEAINGTTSTLEFYNWWLNWGVSFFLKIKQQFNSNQMSSSQNFLVDIKGKGFTNDGLRSLRKCLYRWLPNEANTPFLF